MKQEIGFPRRRSLWNETDFDYLSRRFAEDGLFYWFEHQPAAHRLIVANHASRYRDGREPGVRIARPRSGKGRGLVGDVSC
jgi:uncharacterized protein involved in type VI secretion and phage assembly